jgi:hypothetical protein
MYYKYHEQSCIILAKSETPFEQSRFTCHSEIDFDLYLYEVIAGDVSAEGELSRYTQFERENYALQRIMKKQEQQDLAQLDLDFRVCKIELGL